MPLQTASFATHCCPHRRNPPSHRKSHVPPLHVAVPLAGFGQGAQESPQDAVLVLSLHSVPHLWKPPLQSKAQVPFAQVAWLFGGGLHGLQDSQNVTSFGSTQVPVQFF
jgi:hypothetical protein